MGLDENVFNFIARDVARIREKGIDVVIVSSGAVIAGMQKLGMKSRPQKLVDKQSAAAVGQSQLMWMYEKHFREYGQKVAQILISHYDMADRKRFLNARHTINNLFEWGVIPIINENDTVAVDEIKFGDNDELSSLVVNLIDSSLLIILSDVDGVFTENPKKCRDAKVLPFVEDASCLLEVPGLESDGHTGTGGMRTKILASRTASAFGAATIIANGKEENVLSGIMNGEEVGSFFTPHENPLLSRKFWIAYTLKKRGTITVDDGAAKALCKKGRSLLPSGILSVSGDFESGDMVSCVNGGKEFARGITVFSSVEAEKIMGMHSDKVLNVLGYSLRDEVIHRDDLVILTP